MRVLMIAGLTSAAVGVAGCAQSPYDFPIPTILPDGGRGFAITGYAQFTSDDAAAREEIEATFRQACRGDVTLVRLNLRRADSLAGVPHLQYDAIARCR